jgi:hypothetical protein
VRPSDTIMNKVSGVRNPTLHTWDLSQTSIVEVEKTRVVERGGDSRTNLNAPRKALHEADNMIHISPCNASHRSLIDFEFRCPNEIIGSPCNIRNECPFNKYGTAALRSIETGSQDSATDISVIHRITFARNSSRLDCRTSSEVILMDKVHSQIEF